MDPSIHHTAQPSHQQSDKQSFSKVKLAAIVVGVLIIGAILVFTIGKFFSDTRVDSSRYQAVFLSNGQAYFGKLHDYDSDKPYMSDVYYFQTADVPQNEKAEQPAQTLVKLGDEIHKPDDTLILNRDAILFVENLSGEGSVVQAIEENK